MQVELEGKFVRVKFGDKRVFARIRKLTDGDILSSEDIFLSILEAFDGVESTEFTLKDQSGTEIILENLKDIVAQYGRCGCFSIELIPVLHIQPSETTPVYKCNAVVGAELIINSVALKHFIIEKSESDIFEEYKQKGTITDSSRRCLIRLAAQFLRQVCGNYPKRDEKIATAKAIITLFPVFKVNPSNFDGIDLFYNPVKNSGYLAYALKNINHKRLTISGESGIRSKKGKLNCGSDDSGNEDNENDHSFVLSADDIAFFKNCAALEQEDLIKSKLEKTFNVRKHILSSAINVYEGYPFFFFNPNLVLFEFSLHFPEKSTCLINTWNKYEQHVEDILKETIGEIKEDFGEWNTETLKFLYLLKLLPPTGSGSKSKQTKRGNFKATVEKFLKFEQSNTTRSSYDMSNQQPFIIAVGPNKTAISQYFVCVDKKLICLPWDFSFKDSVDFLFKVFYIFNISFHPDLQNFWKFFSIFVYKISSEQASTRLIEIYSKLEAKLTLK